MNRDTLPPAYAWHFVGATLRDGAAIPADGKWLEFKGPLVMCESGLHFSRKPHQALEYAPDATLCLVEVCGKIIEPAGDDKGVCSRRRIVARMDATELLRYFARMQALSVLDLWDTEPPEVVCDYLMTGDARDAGRAAAWGAARAAAWGAARAAAWDAARDAASDAAWDAARAAAWGAAWDAAWDAFDELVYESFEGPIAALLGRYE